MRPPDSPRAYSHPWSSRSSSWNGSIAMPCWLWSVVTSTGSLARMQRWEFNGVSVEEGNEIVADYNNSVCVNRLLQRSWTSRAMWTTASWRAASPHTGCLFTSGAWCLTVTRCDARPVCCSQLLMLAPSLTPVFLPFRSVWLNRRRRPLLRRRGPIETPCSLVSSVLCTPSPLWWERVSF